MLTLSDLARLRTATASQVQPVVRVGLGALRDVALGEQVPAQVAEVLPGKLYRVLIENQHFTLRLPIDAKPGEVVQLTVSAREPHLRFALAAAEATPDAAAELSDTARFITSLLLDKKSAAPAAARAAAPLLAQPPAHNAHVAGELRSALAKSGIFYESHQAQWVAGERPLANLLQEPQASLPPLRGADAAQAEQRASGAQSVEDGAGPVPRAQEGPIHRDASAIVKQQLDTLATHHVTWQGQIWPEQSLHWEIAEEPPAAHAVAQQPEWRTQLKLTLPKLGEVTATLAFTGKGVRVTLDTSAADAAATLAANGAALEHSLLGAGLEPVSVVVNGDGN